LDKFGVVQGWVNEVKRERERLISKLRAIDGIEVFDSKTNFVTFKPMGDADRIYRGLLNRGVSVKNLGDLPVIGHCLRVTVGLPYMNDMFLDALTQVMQERSSAQLRGWNHEQ
jgi:histidinol-phosphate aminotransferase